MDVDPKHPRAVSPQQRRDKMSQASKEIRARKELRKAFVEGAKWCRRCFIIYEIDRPIAWPVLRPLAEAQAKRRYGETDGKESE